MADILQDLPIRAAIDRVFEAVTRPEGLDRWWTLRSSGQPIEGSEYDLSFGPEYRWGATVVRCVPNRQFELEMVRADRDWVGTRVRFALEASDAKTWLRFRHTGWRTANDHYRISCHCWAMYLRVLRRYLEWGEVVPYEQRLDV